MMKYIFSFLLISVPFDFHAEKFTRLSSSPTEYPVVVELFTSQGCSSCPAADNLLNETIEKALANGKPVLGLSFHVSYWNYLGWKDPYSKEEFTSRQRRYAEVLRLQSIYTPQMIVNGEYEFVGSDRKKLEETVTHGLHESPLYEITATGSMTEKDAIVHYSVNKEPNNGLLNIALVQAKVQNHVSRGENEGKTLTHYNVVRTLETVAVHKTGEIKITIPQEMALAKGNSIILYLQDRTTLKVLAATKINNFGR